jgi:hypothetical protein
LELAGRQLAVFLAIAAAVSLTTRSVDRVAGDEAIWLLIGAAGVYTTVPDTERALVLLGAAGAAALLCAVWLRDSRLGSSGAAVSCTLVVLLAVVDGWARPSAVVGAVGCLGLLVIAPVVTARDLHELWLPMIGLQLVLVAVCSRVAGLRDEGAVAVAIVAAAWVIAAHVVVAFDRRRLA